VPNFGKKRISIDFKFFDALTKLANYTYAGNIEIKPQILGKTIKVVHSPV
jgi:hypothetical protein